MSEPKVNITFQLSNNEEIVLSREIALELKSILNELFSNDCQVCGHIPVSFKEKKLGLYGSCSSDVDTSIKDPYAKFPNGEAPKSVYIGETIHSD